MSTSIEYDHTCRYQKSPGNLKPADIYFGRTKKIPKWGAETKQEPKLTL